MTKSASPPLSSVPLLHHTTPLLLSDRTHLHVTPTSSHHTYIFTHHLPSTSSHFSSWTARFSSSAAVKPPPSPSAAQAVDGATAATNGDPATPAFPTRTDDVLHLDASGHPDVVFALYATLCWYFQLPVPAGPTDTPGADAAGVTREEWSLRLAEDGGAFSGESGERALEAAEQAGLVHRFPGLRKNAEWTPPRYTARCLQRAFWQTSYPFVKVSAPPVYAVTDGVRHPLRPQPGKELFRRYVPHLRSVLHFRRARMDDAPLVNRWMNTPRVARFWQEEGPLEATQKFLAENLAKPHSFPVIGEWEPVELTESGVLRETGRREEFGYFEVYWVKEDRLGRYCEAGEWERGVHVLVGEERFRGRVREWLGGLVEFCWGDEGRTERISLEPRADNERFIKHLEAEGFYCEKYINFPHKRAALMRLTREAWCGPRA